MVFQRNERMNNDMEIVLIRHGKPIAATNPRLTDAEFEQWIQTYRHSKVLQDSRPPIENNDFNHYFMMSSDLPRALDSALIQTGKAPHCIDAVFQEMEIPHYRLRFRCKAWTRVYLFRLFWFAGIKGPFESFSQGKQRAIKAAEHLAETAQSQQKVLLFGHGVTNYFIRQALIARGWSLQQKSSDYWGVTRLTMEK